VFLAKLVRATYSCTPWWKADKVVKKAKDIKNREKKKARKAVEKVAKAKKRELNYQVT
jgi:hypothetical protein